MRNLSTVRGGGQAGPRKKIVRAGAFGKPNAIAEKPNRSSPYEPSPRAAGRGWREAPGEGRHSSETLEERVVRRELLEPLQQHLHRVHRIRPRERSPQRAHLRQNGVRKQLLLFAR